MFDFLEIVVPKGKKKEKKEKKEKSLATHIL